MSDISLIFNFFEFKNPPAFPKQREKMFYEAVQELGVVHVQTDDGGYYVAQVIGLRQPEDIGQINILEDADLEDSLKIRQILEAMAENNSLQNLLNMKDEHFREKNR